MKNWKTTLTGVVSAVAGFIAFSPTQFSKWPLVVELAKYTMAGGIAFMGISAKDNNVTGGTKQQ